MSACSSSGLEDTETEGFDEKICTGSKEVAVVEEVEAVEVVDICCVMDDELDSEIRDDYSLAKARGWF